MKNKKRLYEKAINYWGINSQLDMVVEELCELLVEINKIRRGRKHHIFEEIADTYIMLEQLELILVAFTKKSSTFINQKIKEIKEEKLSRLKYRLSTNHDEIFKKLGLK